MAIKLKAGHIRAPRTKTFVLGALLLGMTVGLSTPVMLGAGSVGAAANTVTQASTGVTNGAAVSYSYSQMSVNEAYPFYITAAFTAASGLFVYAMTYVPARVKSRVRSQYASRVTTWEKTTY